MRMFRKQARAQAPSEFDATHTFNDVIHNQAALQLRLLDMDAANAPLNDKDIDVLARESAEKFERLATEGEAAIDRVADRFNEINTPLRQFKLDHRVERPARKTNLTKSVLILQSFLCVEAASTAALLASDGTMSIAAALMTGTVFSGVNIALGVAAGFFGLRGMTYRSNAEKPKRKDAIIRRAAALFTAVSSAAMVLMHFGAARVRVTGEHSAIWDWNAASFFSTFGDYNALALLAIGALSSLVAVREGWGQLSDPIWGYSRITEETEARLKDAINQTFDTGIERLDNALDNASARIETVIDDYEDAQNEHHNNAQSLRQDISRFNAELKLTIGQLKRAQANETKRRQYIAGVGRKIDPVAVDLAALRKLTIDETAWPSTKGSEALNADKALRLIEDAHEEACAKLEAAHASASSLTTLSFSTFLSSASAQQENS